MGRHEIMYGNLEDLFKRVVVFPFLISSPPPPRFGVGSSTCRPFSRRLDFMSMPNTVIYFLSCYREFSILMNPPRLFFSQAEAI